MRKLKQVLLVVTLMLSLMIVSGYAKEKVINKTFKAFKNVKIATVSGDCIVKKGKGNQITVHLVYTFDNDCYQPKFNQEGDKLELRERFEGYGCSGSSSWTVTVPEKTNVAFKTASGSLEISGITGNLTSRIASGNVDMENCSGEMVISTASGNIKVKNASVKGKFSTASGNIVLIKVNGELKVSTASGDIDVQGLNGTSKLSTASGDIELENSIGKFRVSVASGQIAASGIVLKGKSSFSAASGDVELVLAKSAAYDLKVSTASGDAVLDYNGSAVKGFFEVSADKEDGRIVIPFKADKSEEFTRWGNVYIKKSFTRGGSVPKVVVRTSSGKAELKK